MTVGIDPDLDESGKAQWVCSRTQRSRLDSCYVCYLAAVRPAAFGIITLEVTPLRRVGESNHVLGDEQRPHVRGIVEQPTSLSQLSSMQREALPCLHSSERVSSKEDGGVGCWRSGSWQPEASLSSSRRQQQANAEGAPTRLRSPLGPISDGRCRIA